VTFDVFAVRGLVEHPIADGVEAADALDAAARTLGWGCALRGAAWRGATLHARLQRTDGTTAVYEVTPATVPAGDGKPDDGKPHDRTGAPETCEGMDDGCTDCNEGGCPAHPARLASLIGAVDDDCDGELWTEYGADWQAPFKGGK